MKMIPTDKTQLTRKYNPFSHLLLITGNRELDTKAIEIIREKGIYDQNLVPIMFLHSLHEKKRAVDYCNSIHVCDVEIYDLEDIADLLNFPAHIQGFHDSLQQYCHANYFLLIVSLTVARAEAIGACRIWFPVDRHTLARIAYSVDAYRVALQALAKEGGLYNQKLILEFPLLTNNTPQTDAGPVPAQSVRNKACTILFSGGLDSTAAAYIMQSLGHDIHLFNVQYGQSNRKQENRCIENNLTHIRRRGNTSYRSVSFPCIQKFEGSAITDDNMKIKKENTTLEYVPFRNTILINLAIFHSLGIGVNRIVTGGHRDDTLSPDNNLEYFKAFQKVLHLQRGTINIELYPVLLHLGGKCELIYLLNQLGGKFEYCWSCLDYMQDEQALVNCGECGNCATRYHAFARVGLPDPIPYKTKPHERTQWYGWTKDCMRILKELQVPKKEFC